MRQASTHATVTTTANIRQQDHPMTPAKATQVAAATTAATSTMESTTANTTACMRS